MTLDLPYSLKEVFFERQRQDAKWGVQSHPDGTEPSPWRLHKLAVYRDRFERHRAEGRLTWLDVLNEEVAEAFAESEPVKLRAELVQVAAVAVAWIEAIDRRAK
jgi:hypothetical protein